MKDLVDLLLKQKSREEMQDFLKAILTPKEQDELSKRIKIVKLLKTGVPQREIAYRLGVGIATVTRGAKELESPGFKML